MHVAKLVLDAGKSQSCKLKASILQATKASLARICSEGLVCPDFHKEIHFIILCNSKTQKSLHYGRKFIGNGVRTPQKQEL